MSERRFALVDFTYRGKTGRLRFHEAGHTYALPRAVARCNSWLNPGAGDRSRPGSLVRCRASTRG
jgi:hypothetical protein